MLIAAHAKLHVVPCATIMHDTSQLTAQEYEDGKTFQSNDAKVYFNVYDGAYSHYEPVINVALWNEWVYYEYSEADQVLAVS